MDNIVFLELSFSTRVCFEFLEILFLMKKKINCITVLLYNQMFEAVIHSIEKTHQEGFIYTKYQNCINRIDLKVDFFIASKRQKIKIN